MKEWDIADEESGVAWLVVILIHTVTQYTNHPFINKYALKGKE
jgi:hypothetical protein